MSDELARTADDHEPVPAKTTETEAAAPARPPLTSILFRQVGTLAGGALLGQATWGSPWFVAVVAAVVLIEGLIIWDWRHPKRRA
ncbi:MAG: hypothetical protein BGO38_14335 [Cellulomonas sp. 73-145]|uniref:hypothetical protein n=1 Tax=Cellulomonas sp. 73-145 TaxID=1895739 RepID=UPI00092761AE|nr:hypothetical protein [Cellulomonas sp. 73-145]MBN9326954.1 hypothetical protein [Cellulomonas sp.]OJV58599.1 MAG: hypothetical protein BGO38_14335 [Cellulomonas sp. 73-145]